MIGDRIVQDGVIQYPEPITQSVGEGQENDDDAKQVIYYLYTLFDNFK